MRHVVLTGFMATGKTAVGRRLAKRLGFDFMDTDQLIEERERLPVSEIFARRGEAEFRSLEREIVGSLAPARASVIATGGGTFVDETNRMMLRRLGPVVCLITSLETTLERVGRNDKRPLATGEGASERLARLLESRRPFYRMADVLVETDGLSVEQAVARVATAIAPRLRGDVAQRAASLAQDAAVAVIPGSILSAEETGPGAEAASVSADAAKTDHEGKP